MTFGVPIKDDNILEDDEDFTLNIMDESLPDGVIVGILDIAMVNITDNDGKQSVYIDLLCIAVAVP